LRPRNVVVRHEIHNKPKKRPFIPTKTMEKYFITTLKEFVNSEPKKVSELRENKKVLVGPFNIERELTKIKIHIPLSELEKMPYV